MDRNGTIPATRAAEASNTSGATENTNPVLSDTMRCLPRSLRRSRHGWTNGGPTRPSSRDRITRIIPTSSGASGDGQHHLKQGHDRRR